MDDKYISLITRYLTGDLTGEDREKLFELINSSEEHKMYFDEMQQLWELSEKSEEEIYPSVDVDAAWEKVSQRTEATVKPISSAPKTSIFRLANLLKIAAVFVALVAAFLVYQNQLDKDPVIAFYETGIKEKLEIKLPDNSVVWLNENSKLSYDEKFEPRTVQLEGEAFFDVQHLDAQHPFEIVSGTTTTRVLGTSFNVRAYANENQVEVTVETGKVSVKNEQTQKVAQQITLDAGESGIYQKQEERFLKPELTISNANAWKTQQLEFDDAEIVEVADVMERYFDIKVEIENDAILNCPFTGTYKNPDIDQLVEVLKFSLDIDIKQDENKLIFSGEGCD